MKKLLSYIIACSMLSTIACAEENTANPVQTTAYAAFEAEYTKRDADASYDEGTARVINLSVGSQTITEEGVYVLTGTLNGGSVTIDAPDTDKIQLVLRDANIASVDGPAIYVKQCDKLFITLEGENSISDSAAYTIADTEPDAAIFSENDVTINGSGSLAVTGNYKHGIESKDDVKITGGTIDITSAEDGIKGKDSVLIKDGKINIIAGTDGIQSSNTNGYDKGRISIDGGSVTIVSGNDGIQAESVLQVNGGTLDIKAGDEANTEIKVSGMGGHGGMRPGGMRPGGMVPPMGEGGMPQDRIPGGDMGFGIPGGGMRPGGMMPPIDEMLQSGMLFDDDANEEIENAVSIKGLKSANALYINGGELTISAQDDALHSDVALTVNGGKLSLRSADDGIHAEYDCIINGGEISIARCYEGVEGKTVAINGGNIDITAEDDGINASNPAANGSIPGRGDDSVYIEINGGTINVVSKFDSLDANGNIFVNGGNTTLDGPSNGMDSAIDCDGRAYVNGGVVAASGMGGGTSFESESEQGNIMVVFSQRKEVNVAAEIYDADGKLIAGVTPTQPYGGVVFSSPELKKGNTYTVRAGETSVEVGLSETSIAVSDTGEAVRSGMGFGMPGGGRGGRRVFFDDVPVDAWYSQYVNFVAGRGIMEGKDGVFGPEKITTRAEYVNALYKAAGSPAVEGIPGFDDVSADAEYANAVAWAQANGIATGTGDGSFMPDGSLTREMSMTFLYRALDALNITRTDTTEDVLSEFSDNSDVSDWAREAMNALVDMGVINGTDEGKLNPQGELINAEVAAMLCRVLLNGMFGGMMRM